MASRGVYQIPGLGSSSDEDEEENVHVAEEDIPQSRRSSAEMSGSEDFVTGGVEYREDDDIGEEVDEVVDERVEAEEERGAGYEQEEEIGEEDHAEEYSPERSAGGGGKRDGEYFAAYAFQESTQHPSTANSQATSLGLYEEESVDGEAAEDVPVPEEVYHIVVDVERRAIRVIPPEYNEHLFAKIEEISAEKYATLGNRVSGSDLDADDDNAIYCELCVAFYEASCLKHPLYWVRDRAVTKQGEDRAKKTLPAFFRIRMSSIPNAGYGVFTTVDVPVGSVFGPYQGLLIQNATEADAKGYSWEIRKKGGRAFVDGYNTRYSNWMRYINSSRHEREQNLIAFQYNGSVYYRVFKPINKEQELLVWYGDKYGESLGVHSTQPTCQRYKAILAKPANKNPFIL